MSEPCVIKPDREFVERIVRSGGESLKRCYQCATCSVVCELSPPHRPFPRKEMVWAQWGLKDRLFADPDVWLCYSCEDCSKHCPREARPGDVLAAVRQEAVAHYAVPKFLSTWVNQPKFLWLILVVPAVLLLFAMFVLKPLGEKLIPGEPHGFYAEMFPHWLLIGFFNVFTGLAALAAIVGVVRFWQAMKTADRAEGGGEPVLGIVPSIIRVVQSIVTHGQFSQCGNVPKRRTTHLFAFYGFMALFVVTVWAVCDLYVNPHLGIKSLYPFNLMHPMKIVANLGCAALIIGCVLAIRDRKAREAEGNTSTSFDWMFIWMLTAVGITGLVTEIFRFSVEPFEGTVADYTAWTVYFVHLVVVFALLVYLPYSKFAHLVYRTTAMVYAEHTGRNREPGSSNEGSSPGQAAAAQGQEDGS